LPVTHYVLRFIYFLSAVQVRSTPPLQLGLSWEADTVPEAVEGESNTPANCMDKEFSENFSKAMVNGSAISTFMFTLQLTFLDPRPKLIVITDTPLSTTTKDTAPPALVSPLHSPSYTIGVGLGVGVEVAVGVKVAVGIGVELAVGVMVGPNNCPGPQADNRTDRSSSRGRGL
jgi:hypothetical protein